jgi:hypothetical protein
LRQKGRDHPAIRAHDALLSLIQGVKFDSLTWKSEAADVGVALLDSLDIREVDPSSTWYLLAEPEALRQIRSRLASPDEFQDQFAVIRCWSLLRAKGAIAKLVERPGFPDLLVEVPSDLWIEVKRLRLGTRPARVRDVISKANRQLKNAAPQTSGLVYLQITRVVSAAPLTDEVPPEVLACISEVRRELGSGHSKSVGRVAIAWDDMATLGEPPALTKVVLRRRTLVLDHPLWPLQSLSSTPRMAELSTSTFAGNESLGDSGPKRRARLFPSSPAAMSSRRRRVQKECNRRRKAHLVPSVRGVRYRS